MYQPTGQAGLNHKFSYWLFLTNDWLLYTSLVFLFSIIPFWLFEETAFEVAETLLAPWFVICRILTPPSWIAERGNILLAMMWLFSGCFAYSMLISACLVICRRHLARRRLEQPASNARGEKK